MANGTRMGSLNCYIVNCRDSHCLGGQSIGSGKRQSGFIDGDLRIRRDSDRHRIGGRGVQFHIIGSRGAAFNHVDRGWGESHSCCVIICDIDSCGRDGETIIQAIGAGGSMTNGAGMIPFCHGIIDCGDCNSLSG